MLPPWHSLLISLRVVGWHRSCKSHMHDMDRSPPSPPRAHLSRPEDAQHGARDQVSAGVGIGAVSGAGSGAGSGAVSGAAMDRAVPRRPLWRRRLLWLAAGLAGVATALLVTRGSSARSLTVGADRLALAPVTRGAFEDFVQLRGEVTPLRTTYVDSLQGGQVEAVHVEDGAEVERGQLLVKLSNTALQLDLISREAQITEQLNNLRGLELAHEQSRLTSRRELVDTEYQLARLRRQIERDAALAEEGAVPRATLDDARDELAYQQQRLAVLRDSRAAAEKLQRAQMVQLRAAAQQLEKNLEVARRNLDSLDVRAPAAGKLSAFSLEVGQSLRAGDRIARIDDPAAFKLVAELDEYYLPRVELDQRAEYPVADKVYPLRVRKLRPQVQDGHFQLELEFLGAQPTELRRGQTAQTRLVLGQPRDAVLIPNGAYLDDTGGTWVFVVVEGGRSAVRRSVRLGRRNPQYLEVLAGLLPGESIVISSYANYQRLDRLELAR